MPGVHQGEVPTRKPTSPTPRPLLSVQRPLWGPVTSLCRKLTNNVELNIQVRPAKWSFSRSGTKSTGMKPQDITADILRVIERHTRDYTPFKGICQSHAGVSSEAMK